MKKKTEKKIIVEQASSDSGALPDGTIAAFIDLVRDATARTRQELLLDMMLPVRSEIRKQRGQEAKNAKD